jgi:hypothetical protein
MQPYSLRVDDGTFVAYGIPFLIKLGECAHGCGIAMVRYRHCTAKSRPSTYMILKTKFSKYSERLTFV